MQVKGTTIIARREQITHMFGEHRWNEFIATMAKEDSVFEDSIFVTSRISVESFLKFNEMLVETFFDGDENAYSILGSSAAEWVFTKGPYKKILELGMSGLEEFLESVPGEIWDKYYDFGELRLEVFRNTVTVKLCGIPRKHPYFELTVAGFMKKAMELAGLQSPTIMIKESDEEGVVVFQVEHQGWRRND